MPWRVALSIAWFIVGLVAFIAAEVVYGFWAAPIRHVWHAVAYLLFIGWLYASKWLHRPRLQVDTRL